MPQHIEQLAIPPTQLLGLHAPNRRLHTGSNGPDSFWGRVSSSSARWVKMLWPEHNRADALQARALGAQVIVRAPGESLCYASDLDAMLAEFAGVAWGFEMGNEPQPDLLWEHCWNIEYNAVTVKLRCNRAGIRLITPGWGGNTPAPEQPLGANGQPDYRHWSQWPATDPRKLAARIIQTYAQCDAIGFHVYGEHVLELPQIARIRGWGALWPHMLLCGTEMGIAARDLIGVPPDPTRYAASSVIKAQRYVNFATQLGAACDQVACLCIFIDDGATAEWGSFNLNGKYDPLGVRGYTLGAAGWSMIGKLLEEYANKQTTKG